MPSLSRRLSANQRGFVENERGFSLTPRRADHMAAQLPERADGAVTLRPGLRNRDLVRVRTVGTGAAPGRLQQGHVLYPDALPGADLLWLAAGDAIEQLALLTRDAKLAWELELSPRVAGHHREASGAIVFEDAAGDGLLRVLAPLAVDATGHQYAIEIQADYAPGHATLRFEPSGVPQAYPLLVDPAVEVVTWEQKALGQSVPGRYRHAMAYDEKRKVVVMFGGTNGSPLGDTWEWNGASWKQAKPPVSPDARSSGSLSYFDDGQSSGVLLFGGGEFSSNVKGDTWLFDGTTWTQLSPTQSPPARRAHATAWVASKKQVLLFGGSNGKWLSDTWLFDGNTWTQSTAGNAPGGRFNHALAYDTKLDRVVLFGGRVSFALDDTWEWGAATGAWGQRNPATIPPARGGHGLAYDSRVGRTVMTFGDDASYADDTWEWDGSDWEQRAPLTLPAPYRTDTAMAYDVERDRVVMFGGYFTTGLSDTWVYRRYGGKCTTQADCDGAACLDGVCCASAQCGTCEACSPVDGQCAAVTNAPDPDTCSGTSSCDASGQCKNGAAVACTAGGDCASGFCADGVCCDSACTGACEACDRPGQEGTCGFVTGSAKHGVCPGAGPCGASCTGLDAECQFAVKETECGGVCSGGILTRSSCDGQGNCFAAGPSACPGNFACESSEACATSCSSEQDCAAGYVCDGGQCRQPLGGSVCSDDFTTKDPSGAEHSCTPYKCAGGVCRESCSSAGDCADGFVCSDEFRCSPLRAPADDGGGCGCRSAGRDGSSGAWLFALLALGIASRRRTAHRR